MYLYVLLQDPIGKLAMTCQQTAEPDLDKVVVALSPERMDFAVDGGSLQALQPLLQWVADVSLYLVAALSHNTGTSGGSYPGASLLHDASFMAMLRELLVVSYMWGMITPSCLPHLGARDLQRLFSLITQLWLKAKEGRGGYEESLLDECGHLTTHLAVPQMDQAMFGGHFSSTLIFSQPLPVKLSYGEAPGYVKRRPSTHPILFSPDGQPPSSQMKDVVRLIHLGVNALDDVKMCSRCRCLTLMDFSIPTKLAATGSWEGKWVRQCLCGGMWMYGIV
jgi:mediator of RNA polymerase II transcription subunit 16